MTTKEWLLRGWLAQKELNSIRKAKDSALTVCEEIKKQETTNSDKASEAYLLLADCYAEKASQLLKIQLEIEKAINQLSKDSHRILLRERYINHMSWKQIAQEMNYEPRQVFRLHGKALLSLKNFLDCM